MKSAPMTPVLAGYIDSIGYREHPVLAQCRTETAAMGDIAIMQISPEQGAVMGVLAKAIGVRRYLEIGTFTGYSALAIALAVPVARLDCCDVSEEYTGKAQAYWMAAGVVDRIALHLAPGTQTLDRFIADGRAGAYDMAFIDADKQSYDAYYERALTLVRPGGLIAIDNAFMFGAVADETITDDGIVAIRALNAKVHADDRVDAALMPMADGIMLALKR
ncbi:MAG: SAM-dependent methyltransferase [Alphaproteobacteria bacterium]|nr:SAM-dependent methyltransferase [Alphaproteobacteria bacterium]